MVNDHCDELASGIGRGAGAEERNDEMDGSGTMEEWKDNDGNMRGEGDDEEEVVSLTHFASVSG